MRAVVVHANGDDAVAGDVGVARGYEEAASAGVARLGEVVAGGGHARPDVVGSGFVLSGFVLGTPHTGLVPVFYGRVVFDSGEACLRCGGKELREKNIRESVPRGPPYFMRNKLNAVLVEHFWDIDWNEC